MRIRLPSLPARAGLPHLTDFDEAAFLACQEPPQRALLSLGDSRLNLSEAGGDVVDEEQLGATINEVEPDAWPEATADRGAATRLLANVRDVSQSDPATFPAGRCIEAVWLEDESTRGKPEKTTDSARALTPVARDPPFDGLARQQGRTPNPEPHDG